MAVTDDRVIPLASLRLFHAGQGDPIITDTGFRFYDILEQSWATGTPSRTSAGEPKVEYVNEVGLVLKPTLQFQDTRLTNYSTSGGTWEERQPISGAARKYRLVQIDTTADIQYSATGKWGLSENPHVAFSVLFVDTPPDHNVASFPPFVRIELGNDQWALEFSKTLGSRLLKKVSGSWEQVMDLPQPTGSSVQDLQEVVVYLRPMRGKIVISTDFGRTYVVYDEGATQLTIQASPLTVRGQGGMLIFGLHQLEYQTGATYTSPQRRTYTARNAVTPTLTARKTEPAGTSITLADASPAGPTDLWAYRATLNRGSTTGVPFTFYTTPVLHAVKFTYPVTTKALSGLGSYTTPWDGSILQIDVDKPIELDGASASVRVRLDSTVQFTGNLRWRKCLLRIGHHATDGTNPLEDAFLGYIRDAAVEQNEFGRMFLRLVIDNATAKFKAKRFDLFTAPVGGLTLNAALEEIILTEGITPRTSWWSTGASIVLPSGKPEDPAYWPKRGENKWEFMKQMAEDAGLELGITDDGRFFTVPRDFVNAGIAHIWDLNLSDGELKKSVQGISHVQNNQESVTAVIVAGQDEYEREVFSYGIDTVAEGTPASDRFCEIGRIIHFRELGARTTLGQCNIAVQGDYAALVPPRFEADVEGLLNLNISRRDRVRILNSKQGIPDAVQHVVLTLRHRVVAALANCRTVAGVLRLP